MLADSSGGSVKGCCNSGGDSGMPDRLINNVLCSSRTCLLATLSVISVSLASMLFDVRL